MPRAGYLHAGLLLAALLAWAQAVGGEAPPPADPEEPKWKAEVRGKLEKKINFEFVQAPLTEVINFLQQTSGVNFVLDPAVREEAGQKLITLRMNQATLSLALEWILKLAGLDCELRGNAVFISAPDKLKPELKMVIYDVGDLTANQRDHPAPEIDLAGRREAGGAPPAQDGEVRITPGAIRDMVVARIRPESWQPGKGTSIEERAAKLIVVQRPEVHRLIAALLADLRPGQLIPLETSVRFYAVEPGKLAEAEKAGRLLAEAVATGGNAQRVHNLCGKTFPAADKRDAVFTGALLDVRPVLAADRRSATLAATMGLWLAAGPEADPAARVRVFRAPVNVSLELGKSTGIPLGALRGEKGDIELVVAVLGVRAREPDKLAALFREEPEPDWKVRIRQALDKEVNLEFVEQPLEECLKFIQGLTDVNIIADPAAFAAGRANAKQAITLRLTRTKLGLALKWILRMAKLDYALKNGAVFISTPEKLQSELWMCVYDVRDLTAESPHHPGPQIDEQGRVPATPAGQAAFLLTRPGSVGLPPGAIQDMVKRVIQPASWGAGGTNIQEQNGQVIVFHTPEVQKQIAALLADLRFAARPEVRVDIALYALDAGDKARTAAEVEKSGKLLSRLATVGDNLRRLHAVGGAAVPTLKAKDEPVQFTGAIFDCEPRLNHDRKQLTAELRLSWVEENLSTARMKGDVSLRAGEPSVVELGTAGGRRIAAVLGATVRGADMPGRVKAPPDDDPPVMEPPPPKPAPPPPPPPAPPPAPPAPKPPPDVF